MSNEQSTNPFTLHAIPCQRKIDFQILEDNHQKQSHNVLGITVNQSAPLNFTKNPIDCLKSQQYKKKERKKLNGPVI